MDFIHPGLLAGGLLAALPIVLHLMMRQKPKHIEFPALRFVQAKQTSNRRTLKLRHLLLLFLRMAAIALLAMALARPSAKLFGMFGDQEGPITAVLVFDTSPRMGYVAEKRTRLEAARQFADQLLATLPEQSEIGVVDTSTSAHVFEADATIARERIAKLKVGGRGLPLAQACEGAAGMFTQATHERKELYIFTDFSAGAWAGNRAAQWIQQARDAGVGKIQLIDVGATNPVNYSLGNLSLSDQTLVRNRPLMVSCSVSGVGAPATRIVRISVVDRATGKLVERGVQQVDLGADDTKEATFTLTNLDVGYHQGEVRIDDVDNLPEDNVRYFTVRVRPSPRILVAAADPAAAHAAYYTQAVAGRELQLNGIAPYEVLTQTFEKLAAEELSQYGAVVLLDPPPPADQVWQQLEAYARSGGGVAIFLGPAAQPAPMNGEFAQLVLAGKLGIQARYPQGDLCLWPDADQHPLLADFKPVKNTTPWEDFPVFRYWQLEPAPGTTLVAPYNNDAPAIVERVIGLGRAVTMTTPISELSSIRESDRWNLLPIGPQPWPFVVLVNGMTTYLIGRESPVNYLAEQTAVVRLDPTKRFETYLITQSGAEGPPLRITADLERNQLTVPIADAAGNYRVQAGGAEDGVDVGFSVNIPAAGDAIRRVDPKQIETLFKDAPHQITREFAQLKRDENPDRRGRELFPILICVVALVLGAEQVMANRFYRN
ncbi:MAG: VWA domain-containing protein [Planctomycetaceae bacterium]|nr:VWA domain-containing protein [Planctomycetaceae bacterium]